MLTSILSYISMKILHALKFNIKKIENYQINFI